MSIILDFKITERKGKVIVKAITAGERETKSKAQTKLSYRVGIERFPFSHRV